MTKAVPLDATGTITPAKMSVNPVMERTPNCFRSAGLQASRQTFIC